MPREFIVPTLASCAWMRKEEALNIAFECILFVCLLVFFVFLEQFLPILSDTLDSVFSEEESQGSPVVRRQLGGSDTQLNIQDNIQAVARNVSSIEFC